MAKNIIKEIIIVLLLVLAIILVWGVLLYGYIPANIIIPEKISYTTPETVKTELEVDVKEDDEEMYFDYHIDSTQLNNYQKIQEYVPGRKNPFASFEKDNTSNTIVDDTSQNSTTNNGSSTSSETQNINKIEESTGYLPDKGTK